MSQLHRRHRLWLLTLTLFLTISAHSWPATVVAQNGVGTGPPRKLPMSMSNRRATRIDQQPTTFPMPHETINQIIDKYN